MKGHLAITICLLIGGIHSNAPLLKDIPKTKMGEYGGGLVRDSVDGLSNAAEGFPVELPHCATYDASAKVYSGTY
jgi:hypothetical protein